MNPIRVFIAEDHPAMRIGLRTLLSQAPDIEIVGEAGRGEDALRLTLELQPDVIILDCQLPGMDGPAVAREIQRSGRDTRILALSSFADDRYMREMLEAGAIGYVLKEETPERIVGGVRSAVQGQSLWQRAQIQKAERWAQEVNTRWKSLTSREREVLWSIAAGKSNKQIAAEFNLSAKTIEYHLSNLFGKLGVHSRTEAVVWLEQSGLSSEK